jgi:WD40 repeat protein
VRLWDIKEGKQVLDLQLGGSAWSVAFSPDGRLLAAGDSRGTLKVWKMAKPR